MYIGTKPESGFITTAKQRVTSSTNNYVDLDHSISSLSDCILWVNSIKQDSTNLTLTTSTRITLGDTLTASDIVEIAYLGKAVATQTPDNNTITNDMLVGSIANSKLATDPLNASNLASGTVPTARLGSGTASSSNFLRGDGSWQTAGGVAGTESFKVVMDDNQTVSSGTFTLVNYDKEIFDNGGNYDTSNKKFTAPSTGTYQFNINLSFATDGSYGLDNVMLHLAKNGTRPIANQFSIFAPPTHTGSGSFDTGSIGCAVLINLSANDYIQCYARSIKNSNATSTNLYSDNERRSEWSGFRVT